MNSRSFEDWYEWQGDALSEMESAEFQAGKAAALSKLLRFTHPDSDEAASVVLKQDGSEFDYQVGTPDEVPSRLPANESVAVLHTHPAGFPHSPEDWRNLITQPVIQQLHIITARKTYSLHKPPGWPPANLTSVARVTIAQMQAELDTALEMVAQEDIAAGYHSDDEAFFERATHLLARKYGIIFRVGERK